VGTVAGRTIEAATAVAAFIAGFILDTVSLPVWAAQEDVIVVISFGGRLEGDKFQDHFILP
jgi:hypothetical protein